MLGLINQYKSDDEKSKQYDNFMETRDSHDDENPCSGRVGSGDRIGGSIKTTKSSHKMRKVEVLAEKTLSSDDYGRDHSARIKRGRASFGVYKLKQ